MTQAEKIAVLFEILELLELALACNDRQQQLDYVRKAGELRRSIAP